MLDFFPKYFTNKATLLYVVSLLVVGFVFMNHAMSPVWWIFGIVEVIGFFYFSNLMTVKWSEIPKKFFLKNIFRTGLIIRLIWVVFSYFFYISMTGQPFEFETADAFNYHSTAIWIKNLIQIQHFEPYGEFVANGYSDSGYPTYLSILYLFTGDSILIARILKALIGAYMCVLVYKLASRTFGEGVGRMSAIFCVLMPNIILYAGLHLKEVEMVFLTVWFIERADAFVRNRVYSIGTILPLVLLTVSLFFFRTVLGVTALFAIFSTMLFSSRRVMSWSRRFVIGIWVFVIIMFFIGGKIATEVEEVWLERETNQANSLEWRTEREGGNQFSKYASSAVFAPLIFVIPFPSMVSTPGQENQQLIHGGNFVKNILAFFLLFGLYFMLKENVWRDYMLIASFTAGYLLVIALSAFAQSERFHQPALPFILILAAFGISKSTDSIKVYYKWYLVVIFAAILVWSWFKLAGRGMI